MVLALGTIKAVQVQYARNGSLAMMHVDHAMGICGGIIHVCSAQETNSGDLNRCKGGGSQKVVFLSIDSFLVRCQLHAP